MHIKTLQFINVLSHDVASPQSIRSINVIGSILLAWVVYRLLRLKRARGTGNESSEGSRSKDQPALIHTTVNVCLFPPLFFFYALYYTDVLSALAVLFAYQCFLEKRGSPVLAFTAGIVSLVFRQTNIFWVSLFLGGLAFCCAIRKGRVGIEFSKDASIEKVIRASWRHGCSYDPPISQAGFEGLPFIQHG